MGIHIDAHPGAVAETVLMPGDPLRAKWAAETFLEDVQEVNRLRGMLGFTGRWRGHRVTIHGSGMGMPSMAVYAHELIRDHGARRLLRVGSCGSLQDEVRLRDLVIAQAASSVSTPSRPLFHGASFAPAADFELTRNAVAAAQRRGLRHHVGGIHSADAFYDEPPEIIAAMARHRVLAVEMEAAELYTVAARLGARALAILTVSDHIPSGAAMAPEDRERSLREMFEVALEAAFGEG